MTLSVAASVQASWQPSVLVQVDSSPAVSESLTVYRVHDDGARYKVLTDQPPVMVGGWGGYDYHAPFNEPFTYVAESETMVSPASGAVFLPSDTTWLISASDPELSTVVTAVLDLGELSFDDPAQRYLALGASKPTYRWSRPRSGPSFSLSLHCDSPDEAAQIRAVLRPGGPILLNMHQPDPVGWMWVQPTGSKMGTPGGKWRTEYREWSFGLEQCEQPNLDVTSPWDCAALAAQYESAAAAAAAYADVRSMALDVRL